MTTKYHRVFWGSLKSSYKILRYAVFFIMGFGVVTAILSEIYLTFVLKEKYWPEGTIGSIVSFIVEIGVATIFVYLIFRIRLFFNKKDISMTEKNRQKQFKRKGFFNIYCITME